MKNNRLSTRNSNRHQRQHAIIYDCLHHESEFGTSINHQYMNIIFIVNFINQPKYIGYP